MNDLFNDAYKGKTVLVTGHTGFKGSWLVLWLSTLGARVIGYSSSVPTQPSHYELLRLNIASIMGDVLDKKKLSEALERYKPDIVFHLAAQALVRESYLRPVETFETNIMGTINVLESCRTQASVKAIVNVTSDKCYENKELTHGYTEEDPMGGHDPYSASKGAAEIVSQAYRNSFFSLNDYGKSHNTLLANVRAGNVIGGGDWAKDRLIPDIMKATSKGETVIIRNPQATRPWQHVLEPLSGYLHIGSLLLEGKKEFAENWNFGPSAESNITVGEVANKTKAYWDRISYDVTENTGKFHEARLLMLDSSKAKTKLGWHAVWNSDKTFEKTISWYKNYYDGGGISTSQDLDEYIVDAEKRGVQWIPTGHEEKLKLN